MNRNCGQVLANGEICRSPALRDSNLCYWHHKARSRRLRRRVPRKSDAPAVAGVVLPLLEDANAVQIGLQEVLHALLDGRIEDRRAGLLLYGLQVATSNLLRLETRPSACADHIASIGRDDGQANDEIDTDEEEEAADAAEAAQQR